MTQCFQGCNEICSSPTPFLGLYIDIIPLKSNLAVSTKSHKMLMSWDILCFETSENLTYGKENRHIQKKYTDAIFTISRN